MTVISVRGKLTKSMTATFFALQMVQVTGELVSKLDNHYLTVRDCSWHPYYPTLGSSSWDGLVARWEFSSSVADPSLVKKNSRIVSEDSMFNHIFL